MYETYKDRAAIFVVYIREAHPSDGWQVGKNTREGIVFKQPKSEEEREKVATSCKEKLELTIPILIDGMDNKTGAAYSAWPDRLYVVDTEGKLAFVGDRGPRGFNPADAEAALKKLLPEEKEKEKEEETEEDEVTEEELDAILEALEEDVEKEIEEKKD